MNMNIIEHIKANGPIPCIRVSQAVRNACRWSYVDLVPYEIRLTADGQPAAFAMRAARRKYRSVAKAERLADESGQLVIGRIGRLTFRDVCDVQSWLNNA